MRVLTIFGTRPEAIKMAPVVAALETADDIESVVCSTGQHAEMLDQVMSVFDMTADFDLRVMKQAQSLTSITTSILEGLEPVIREVGPDWVLVHGDTTTAFASALAGFYQHVPVGHVEAGLRTGQMYSPWPEELNRSLVGRLATTHFAPTERARQNLLAENVSESAITVTGNTVIDALRWLIEHRLDGQTEVEGFDYLDPDKRLVLVTGHRRESFDGGLADMCKALGRLAERGDVQVVYPVHLNPVVQDAVNEHLEGLPNVYLESPQDYLPFVWLMSRADLIITDSGGIQEEAPSLGVPVLVTRDVTERPEAIEAGVVELVGTSTEIIVTSATRLLDDEVAYQRMSAAANPYGDGHAAERIVTVLRHG